jgi:hypothetical protein
MAAEASAEKISQIGGGALRRPRRAAPLPKDDWPNFEAAGFSELRIEEVEEDLAIPQM